MDKDLLFTSRNIYDLDELSEMFRKAKLKFVGVSHIRVVRSLEWTGELKSLDDWNDLKMSIPTPSKRCIMFSYRNLDSLRSKISLLTLSHNVYSHHKVGNHKILNHIINATHQNRLVSRVDEQTSIKQFFPYVCEAASFLIGFADFICISNKQKQEIGQITLKRTMT